MPKKNSDFGMAMKTILNNPQTSFLSNPKTFNEIHKQSGMPLAQMIRQIGRGAKQHGNKRREPTDDERSEERLDAMKKQNEK